MRRRGYAMPVILTSGYSSSTLPEDMRQDRAVVFLSKPFGMAELHEMVASTLGTWQVEPSGMRKAV